MKKEKNNMLLEDSDFKKRYLIGKKIELMKGFREDIVEFLFTTSDANTPLEKTEGIFENAEDIFEVIDAYIRGDSPDAIGESIFQSDGESIIKILSLFGINLERKSENIGEKK